MQNKFISTTRKSQILKKKTFDILFNFVLQKKYYFDWTKKVEDDKSYNCMVIRPLLSVSRYDIKKLCSFWKLPIYPDQTNQQFEYNRNRIRKQLLPTLRFFFNSKIDKILFQFLEIATEEQIYLDFIATRIRENIQEKNNKTIELETSIFLFLPIAVQRKIIRQFLEILIKKKVKYCHIEKTLELISQKKIKMKKSKELVYPKLTKELGFREKKQNEFKSLFLPGIGVLFFYYDRLIFFPLFHENII